MNRLQAFVERHVIDRDEASAVGRFFVLLSRLILKTALWIIALSAVVLGALYILSQTVWQPKRLVCDGSIVSLPISSAGAEQVPAQLSLSVQPSILPWESGYNFMAANLYSPMADLGGAYYPTGLVFKQAIINDYAIYFVEESQNTHKAQLTYFREINSVSLDYAKPIADGPPYWRFLGQCSERKTAL
jgi:hypothetical protein